MSDLIERLRGGPNSYDSETEEVMATAADALEAATAREAALVAERDAMARQSLSSSNQAAKAVYEKRQLVAQVEALTAKNERLREALVTIRDRKWATMTQGCDAACDAAKIARAALAGKAEQ